MWRQDTSLATEPRAKLSRRGLRWALEGIVCQHLTDAAVAEGLAVAWNTTNDAVLAEGKQDLIDDVTRFDCVSALGVDEHVLVATPCVATRPRIAAVEEVAKWDANALSCRAACGPALRDDSRCGVHALLCRGHRSRTMYGTSWGWLCGTGDSVPLVAGSAVWVGASRRSAPPLFDTKTYGEPARWWLALSRACRTSAGRVSAAASKSAWSSSGATALRGV